MSLNAFGAVVLAFALDSLVAEFPERVHPVAAFGWLVGRFDRKWPAPRIAGAALAVALPLLVAVVAAGLVRTARGGHPLAGVVLAGVVVFATTSRRMLLDVARDVVALTEEDLPGARERLASLAGRDPTGLSAGQVRSAAIESAAENLADGLVGPLLAFGLGTPFGLAVAAGAAAWVKAVNTLDSMLGYPGKPIGRASARLDDLVMAVPARVGAVLLALAAGDPKALAEARAWRNEPRSPNSGWPMATLAAVLRVELEKPGEYALSPSGRLPDAGTALRGVDVVGRAGLLAYAGAGILALATRGNWPAWGPGGAVASGRVLATAIEVVPWS